MSGPHPAVAAVRRAVRDALVPLPALPAVPALPGSVTASGPRPGAGLVLVACSGGADSLALAAATAFVAPRLGLAAGAVVVDHGWLPDSAEVAAGVARTCTALGLSPVRVVAAPSDGVTGGGDGDGGTGGSRGGGGPEAAARTVRYALVEQVRRDCGAVAVLLGHTLEDQAETVLLGLARGSGARSLAGMPARRGYLVRPMLGLPRAVPRAACAALGLQPWEDPANTDPAYARVRARALLDTLDGELGPGLPAALSRTADLLREDAEALEGFAADLLAAARHDAPDGGGVDGDVCVPDAPDGGGAGSDPGGGGGPVLALEVAVLGAAPDAVRRRTLLAAARAAGSPPGGLGRRHVLAVDALVVRWRGQGPVHLPGGVVATRSCGTLLLAGPGGGRETGGPGLRAGTRHEGLEERGGQ